MNYLDFVEDYKNKKDVNLFEKIVIASKRAKDIYSGRTPLMPEPESHKPTAMALYEINHDMINTVHEEIPEDANKNLFND